MTSPEFIKSLHCVVLIDDDSINNFMNQQLLKSVVLLENIVILKNGQDGLDFIQKYFEENNTFPELIFVDINMPVFDGFEFLEKFHKTNKNRVAPTFVVLSTSTDSRDICRLRDLGIKYFFNKPFTREKLNQLIENESLFYTSSQGSLIDPEKKQ
jgi:response regulator RpfG family c-di-GMP phosphodiesterase